MKTSLDQLGITFEVVFVDTVATLLELYQPLGDVVPWLLFTVRRYWVLNKAVSCVLLVTVIWRGFTPFPSDHREKD